MSTTATRPTRPGRPNRPGPARASSSGATAGGGERPVRRFLHVVAEPQTYRNVVYLLLGLPLGTIWFSVLTAGLAVGAGLLVVALTGVPILLGLWYVTRAFANTERVTANALLATELEPAPFGPHGRGNPWRRLRTLTGDRGRARELAFLLLRFPAGVATFTFAVTALAVPFALAYAPLAARIDGDEPFGSWSESDRLERSFETAWSWGAVPIAAITLLANLHLVNAVARASARWITTSLGDRPS